MGLRDHQKSPWKWHLDLMIQFSVAQHHHRSHDVISIPSLSLMEEYSNIAIMTPGHHKTRENT